MEERTYAAAGVSLATADSVVERLRAAVESTGAAGFGAFAGIHPLDDRRLLAASTDGVSWSETPNLTVSVPTLYVGLARSSGNNSAVVTANFDNVTVVGGP